MKVTRRTILGWMGIQLALPLFKTEQRAALKLEHELARPLSPIVSVLLWSPKPLLPEALMALGPENDGSQASFHWAFQDDINVDRFRTCLVSSAATQLAALSSEAIQHEALAVLGRRLPGVDLGAVSQVRVVREKSATPIFEPGSPPRPRQATTFGNLALAGDYTETGLPATIEGAVRSGVLAWEALAI